MNYKLYYLQIISAFFFTSCFSTREIQIKDFSAEEIILPFKIEKLSIVDKREKLLPMNWDVPTFGGKKREWIGNPPLSETNKIDITKIIEKSQNIESTPANIEFRIIEGECKLTADWKSVNEYANFRCEIIIEIPSRSITYQSYSEMYYNYPTINGTEKHTMILYNQSVKNATHMSLKHIRDQIIIDK